MREAGGCWGSAVRWKLGQKLLGDGSKGSKTVARLFQNWWGGRGVAGAETGAQEPQELRRGWVPSWEQGEKMKSEGHSQAGSWQGGGGGRVREKGRTVTHTCSHTHSRIHVFTHS